MKPFIKWVGGKRWLVPKLVEMYEAYQGRRLVEPFVGGMSVALGLNPKRALLNDVSVHLVNLYQQVKLGFTLEIVPENDKEYYYERRAEFNKCIAAGDVYSRKAASLFYYLCKTAFNGVVRFNRSGRHNVPFGSYKSVNYRQEFAEYTEVFAPWTFSCGDFETLEVLSSDWIFADPPYDGTFGNYSGMGFSWEDQVRLATWLASLNVPIVASNSDTQRIRDLYASLGFYIDEVEAPRTVSSNGAGRKRVVELLMTKNL